MGILRRNRKKVRGSFVVIVIALELLPLILAFLVWLPDRDLSAAITTWATGTVALATVALALYGQRQASLLEGQVKMQREQAERQASTEMSSAIEELNSLIGRWKAVATDELWRPSLRLDIGTLRSMRDSLLLCEPAKGHLKEKTAQAITISRFSIERILYALEYYERTERAPSQEVVDVVIGTLGQTRDRLRDGLKEIDSEFSR